MFIIQKDQLNIEEMRFLRWAANYWFDCSGCFRLQNDNAFIHRETFLQHKSEVEQLNHRGKKIYQDIVKKLQA